MELVLVRPGEFKMGSPEGEAGREAQEAPHRVSIRRPFFLGRREVTQGEWRKVMGTSPSRFRDCGPSCPVESVTWIEARAFVAKLGALDGEDLRLPTEAEWEYACRAGTVTAFSTGDALGTDQANVELGFPDRGSPPAEGRGSTMPVGSFPPNPWGLYDMHGNVWEWCEDDACPYPEGPAADPVGRCASGRRIIRGGSWHFGADSARCALRYTHAPGDRGFSLGFRIVRAAPGADR